MIEKVTNQPDNYVDFRVQDGKLLKFVSLQGHPYDRRFEWKVVPELVEIPQILKDCHDSVFHPGYDKTLARIRQRYYWPRMATEVKRYCRQCQTCKEVKPASVPVAPKMGNMKLASHPWQMISVDYIGPLPLSKRGNQYMLVVCDYFSKWVMIQPVRSIGSSSLCAVLRDQWFLRNSVPEIIITDNGSCFLSREFKGLVDLFHVAHWLNSRYHSQANPVERVNRTINAAIRTYVKEDQRLWDTKIPEIQMVLNTSVHASTGHTPYFITHGHEFVESGNDYRLSRHEDSLSPLELEERRRKMFSNLHEIVKKNLTKAYKTSSSAYNLRHRKFAKGFRVGQLIYRRNMKLSNSKENYNAKYGRQFLPCRVKAKHGTSSYELEDLKGKAIGIWPAIHLKP